MEFRYSEQVDPSLYETHGLADGIPLRVHKDPFSEILGSLRAQRDWDRHVSPLYRGYNGNLGKRFSFVRVTVPECLPERLETISYANEFAFLYDDEMETLDLKRLDRGVEGAEMLEAFEGEGEGAGALDYGLNRGDVSLLRPEKRLQAQAFAEMMAIDPARAKTSMKAWARFVQLASRTRLKPFDTLQEYIPARVIDSGELIWFGTLTFGMALTIPDEEMHICMELARPGYAVLGLTNDLYSWEKERDAAERQGQDYVFNAVWVIMKERSVGEEEAKAICADIVRDYVDEYRLIVDKTKRNTALSKDLRAYIEAVIGTMRGIDCVYGAVGTTFHFLGTRLTHRVMGGGIAQTPCRRPGTLGTDTYRHFFPPKPTFSAQEIPSQAGKVFIVTGGASGIGFELVKTLYQKNGRVYIAGRSEEQAAKAIKEIQSASSTTTTTTTGTLEFLHLDLADLSSIKTSADAFKSKESQLHVLFNNAGVSQPPLGSLSKQGHDLQLATNCFGPFLFTRLLLPLLESTASLSASKPGSVRVIWTASQVIELSAPKGGIIMSEIQTPTKDVTRNYTNSKTGNYFLSAELARQQQESKNKEQERVVVSVSLNPGAAATNLFRHTPMLKYLAWPLFHPVEKAATTQLFAGLSEEINVERNGCYVVPWGRVAEFVREDLVEGGKLKGDGEGGTGRAKEFWEFCEGVTGEYM
ncbi:hypothetical protein QBC44DRAFT_344987 [Cladorrhinum sp. PSN332]|nr:hypothetical protein QBC44DRAFT_344987 [Cladorrhinum sp. PSN332]